MDFARRCAIAIALLAVDWANVQQPLIEGLDHTPLVVSNLEKAEADFHAMGFTLKPGRVHSDGIRNAHIKFENGTELELITASKAVDDLTSEYRNKLQTGEGPVYYGLYAPDLTMLLHEAQRTGLPLKEDTGLLTFPATSPLHPIFFGLREKSPTDLPQHFSHANTAKRLSAFWVRDKQELHDLFRDLGVKLADSPTCGPFDGHVMTATLPEGQIYLVTSINASEVLAARLDVQNLKTAEGVLKEARLKPLRYACDKTSIWLRPADAHGIWLQLRQSPG